MQAGSVPGVPVAFVLKGYPRLSETFIAQEIAALEECGLDILIVSLRHPTDRKRHPVNDRIRAPILYLPEYLYQEIPRVLRGWWRARQLPGYRRMLRTWWQDLRRDPSPNRGRRMGQALVLAAELPDRYRRLHAHFVHTPGSVTRYAAQILGIPWSASAHARDLWTTPAWEKREKFLDCEWAVTCNAHNMRHLAELGVEHKVTLVYHGLDLTRWPAPPPRGTGPDGASAAACVNLISVGRAVTKKGYEDLLAALALLPPDLHWRFVHIGAGPLLPKLKALATTLGLGDRTDWRGAQTQDEILRAFRAADLFVLASRQDAEGDMDGLPNVLMEAQSQALPCLATDFSAIPELITAEETGSLVPPGQPAALAAALIRLIRQPDLRLSLGQAGMRRVRDAFSMQAGIAVLAAKFGLPAKQGRN